MELLDVSDRVLPRVRELALALPQTRERTQTYGFTFFVRQKRFAVLMAVEADDGSCSDLLIVTADEIERQALLEQGHPFFSVGAGANALKIGIVLGPDTDWVEIAELLAESYRLLAPEKLIALLDDLT